MAPSDDRLQALVSDLADRVREQVRRELDTLMADARTLAAGEREEAAEHARAEAEAAAASLVSGAIAVERTAAQERLRQAADEALADERQSALAHAERLLGSIRALDRAQSLSDALDALAEAAAAEAGRAALLVVRGAMLKGWAHAGFPADHVDATSIELPLEDAGLLADAVESGERRSTAGQDAGAHTNIPAPFTPGSPDRVGLAVPVTVDGQVVAVVYADDAGEREQEVSSAWPERVEMLARHAGRCLEALTARQTSRGARTGTPLAVAGETSLPDAEGARRFARLLISEIKLYHEAQVDEGRRARDLLRRLQPHIERARQLYEERVSPDVAGRADYFEQELVRTLADGDPVLLGKAS